MNTDLFKMDLYIQNKNNYHINKKKEKIIKRIFDLLISIPLLVISLPIIGVASLCIILDSKGSPIYKQERSGLDGKLFMAYKLRTMYVHSSDGNLKAPNEGDPRVTKIGRFLRKTSIDEIPQFVNVIKGDMSILGPRAVPSKELDLRIKKMLERNPDKKQLFIRAMEIRSWVKPGISGMAQAYGRSSLSVEQATGYDVFYALNHSFLLDIKIFFKTVETVGLKKGVN